MLSISFWVIVGIIIGWNLEQPAWSKKVWAWSKKKFDDFIEVYKH